MELKGFVEIPAIGCLCSQCQVQGPYASIADWTVDQRSTDADCDVHQKRRRADRSPPL